MKLKLAERDGVHADRARAQAVVQRSKLVEFLKDTDVLILDAQYTDEKYQEHIGWGHGALSRVVSLALEARAKKLFLFHHDPSHDDRQIDEMLERARLLVVESGRALEVEAAREGAEIWLSGRRPPVSSIVLTRNHCGAGHAATDTCRSVAQRVDASWCNGSTRDSGSLCQGSNPCEAAT